MAVAIVRAIVGELLDSLKTPPAGYTPARQSAPVHPSKAWTPRIDTEAGEIVVREPADRVDMHDIENAVDWSQHIRAMGLDPDYFTIDEPAEFRTWDAAIGNGQVERFMYFKAKLRRRRKQEDLTALVAEIRAHKPVKVKTAVDGGSWLVVCLADWQMGKQDQDGSAGVVSRVMQLHDSVLERVRELKRAKVPLSGIVVVGMGDLVEGCHGFYPNQSYMIDLDRREQTTVVRRLLLKLVRSWSAVVPEMVVAAVPGNHGQNRSADGTVATLADKDNDDLAVFDQAAEILAENPARYGHVRFVIPNGDDSVTLDLGQVVGFAHGHWAGGGGKPVMARLWEFWTKHTHAMRPIGDAHLMVLAHYHHLMVKQQGPKTMMVCPSIEGGSDYYARGQGYQTRQGTLTFTVSAAGWDRMLIV